MRETLDFVKADAAFLRGDHKAAFDAYFHGATALKLPRAAFNVAFMYQHGFYVPRIPRFALDYYAAAQYLEGGVAQFNLALMYLRGQGTDVDFYRAAEYMRKSAAEGCVDAQIYLGVAYTTGCMFDPLDIDCISMIPFRRVIRQNEGTLLYDRGFDPALDARRFEVLEANEYDAAELFEQATHQKDTTYIEAQVGAANLLFGQALIEGLGAQYNPRRGWRLIERAAIEHGSREAAAYLTVHANDALSYGVDAARVKYLLPTDTNWEE